MWNKAGVVTVLFLSLIQMAQIMDAQEIKLPTCEFAGGKSFMQAVMGRKTKRTCGWWRDNGVSARNISELNGYRRRDGGKTKRFKSLHAFILD